MNTLVIYDSQFGNTEKIAYAVGEALHATEDHGIGLRMLMHVIRFADKRIMKTLIEKGGQVITKPVGFIVTDKQGPLKKVELERAKTWAREMVLYG